MNLKYAGVIEGFYGRPWTLEQRKLLFKKMHEWGLNTYFYAPKDDLKHRQSWRIPYNETEAVELGSLVKACCQNHLHFIYGLAPGLDIDFQDDRDFECLIQRAIQVFDLGCRCLALLFDDIPSPGPIEDHDVWRGAAERQADLVNRLRGVMKSGGRGMDVLFCPTIYCGAMASGKPEEDVYLATLGQNLDPDIEIFWTGPDIISRSITVDHVRRLESVLHRRPLIWDNLHANDYDMRRLFLGPYSGRETGIRDCISGVLSNPNCQFWANFIPIHTLADWLARDVGSVWDPRASMLNAVEDWMKCMSLDTGPYVSKDQLLQFIDAFYLPYEHGDQAAEILEGLSRFFASDSHGPPPDRIASICGKLKGLGDLYDHFVRIPQREVLHDFYRFLWELKEETNLLLLFLQSRLHPGSQGDCKVRSPYHKRGTYRGGFTSDLQGFLEFLPDETFVPRK